MPKLRFQYVSGSQGAETLVQFLTRRFPYHNEPEWTDLVLAGNVTVNNSPVSPRLQLRTGHRIAYERPATAEPPVDDRFHILHEDEHLLVVDKPANLPTSPSGKYWDHCLVHIAAKRLGYRQLYAVHRLDRETSGANVLAKTSEAASILGKAFAAGQVQKEYTAILRGDFPCRDAFVSVPLMNDPEGEIRIRQVPSTAGRKAETRFTLLARLPGASLVRALPLTGRTHQIRAHAWYLGHPVLGDKLYGSADAVFLNFTRSEVRILERRQLLHSSRIRFPHPVTSDLVDVRSSPQSLLEIFSMAPRSP